MFLPTRSGSASAVFARADDPSGRARRAALAVGRRGHVRQRRQGRLRSAAAGRAPAPCTSSATTPTGCSRGHGRRRRGGARPVDEDYGSRGFTVRDPRATCGASAPTVGAKAQRPRIPAEAGSDRPHHRRRPRSRREPGLLRARARAARNRRGDGAPDVRGRTRTRRKAVLLHRQRTPSAPVHVAFASAGGAAVDAFHHEALNAGGRDNGQPGLRSQYHPTYYGAFVLDPEIDRNID